MTQKLNLPAWNKLHKKAKDAITQFYNELLSEAIRPEKMTMPIGCYRVDDAEYEFRVVAIMKQTGEDND